MVSEDLKATATHRGTGIRWSFVVAAVIGAALLALILQNDHDVHFEWLWIDFQASLAVLLLLTAFLTMLATSLVGLVWRARRRRTLDHRDGGDGPGDHIDRSPPARSMRPRIG
jgi:uncharacterized integral membrane protein